MILAALLVVLAGYALWGMPSQPLSHTKPAPHEVVATPAAGVSGDWTATKSPVTRGPSRKPAGP
jgi:hypothetical protein